MEKRSKSTLVAQKTFSFLPAVKACSLFIWGLLILVTDMSGAMAAETEACRLPLTSSDVQVICDSLGTEAGQALGRVAGAMEQQLLDRIEVGLHRTLPDAAGCYSLSGAEIRLYVEESGNVLVDRFRKIGKTSDDPHIQVLACQVGLKEWGSGRFVDTSVQLFWHSVSPDGLTLIPDRPRIPIGGNTGVTARLHCGPCGMESETIFFHADPGGTVSPERAATDSRGESRTLLTLKKERSVRVFAHYDDLDTEALVEPIWRPWLVKVSASFSGRGEGYSAEATFRGQLDGLLLGWMVDQALRGLRHGLFDGFPFPFMIMNPNGPSPLVGRLKGWENRKVDDHWERNDFDRPVKAYLSIGLLFHHGRAEPGRLAMDLSMAPLYLFTGTGGQYFFSFDSPNCAERERVQVAKIPFEAIEERRSLTLESTFRGCGTDQWRYTFTFVPQARK